MLIDPFKATTDAKVAAAAVVVCRYTSYINYVKDRLHESTTAVSSPYPIRFLRRGHSFPAETYARADKYVVRPVQRQKS